MNGLRKLLGTIGCGLALGLVCGPAPADVVVVVSSQSTMNALSRGELADIYLGRINRLPNGDPVVPIDQRESSSAYGAFYREYLGRSAAQIKAHWSKLIFTGRGHPPQTVRDGNAAADAVAEDPHAIGYVEPGLVNDHLRVVPIE